MGLEAFLVGIVVIGANHQRGVSADGLGVLDQFDRLVCGIGPGPGNHGHATFGNFNTKRYDILMLLGGECGRLACCADRHERAGTANNLALYQRRKSVPVNGTIPERCDESWD